MPAMIEEKKRYEYMNRIKKTEPSCQQRRGLRLKMKDVVCWKMLRMTKSRSARCARWG
jgi:hypothetical protein